MNRRSVRFARWAEANLLDIWLHVARESPGSADSLIDRLQDKCFSLGRNAGLGRPFPGRPDLRHFSVHGYYIFYRVLPDAVEIAHVIHTARDVEACLRAAE